jgi:hypothetical protein
MKKEKKRENLNRVKETMTTYRQLRKYLSSQSQLKR